MNVPLNIESELMDVIDNFKNNHATLKKFWNKLSGSKVEYNSFSVRDSIEEKISNLINNTCVEIDCQWYMNFMDEEETEEGYEKIREAIYPYVEDIEKLIIRGNTEGSLITEKERSEWWKKQKEREREEFYNFHGYYKEDEPQ